MLAQEFSRTGVKVRVNSFAPGIFATEMTSEFHEKVSSTLLSTFFFRIAGESREDQKSFIPAEGFREKKGVPAGRPGKDEDIAQVVLSLAVNTYINGQVVHSLLKHCSSFTSDLSDYKR